MTPCALVGDRLADDCDVGRRGGSRGAASHAHGRRSRPFVERSADVRHDCSVGLQRVAIHTPANRPDERSSLSHADRGQGTQPSGHRRAARAASTRRFDKVAKQVSPLAVLEVELCEERNPANPDNQVAEATLLPQGRDAARQEASRDLKHSINLIADELAPPGQAAPRQAPRPARGARGRRGPAGRHRGRRRGPGRGRGGASGRSEKPGAAGPRDRGALSLTPCRSSTAPCAWAKASSSSSTPSASTHQRVGAGARAARRRRAARAVRRAARARARRRVARRPAAGDLRRRARDRAAARWACATSTSS